MMNPNSRKKSVSSLLIIYSLGLTSFLFVACAQDLGNRKSLLKADEAFADGRYDDAINLLTPILETEPTNHEALILRSKSYYEQHDFKRQTEDLKTLLAIEGTSCDDKLFYANAIANNFDYYLSNDSAIRYQWIVFKLQGDCDTQEFTRKDSYQILSNLYCRKQSYDSALILLDSAIVNGANIYSVACARARVFSKMNDLDAAIKWATTAIDSISTFRGHILEPGWNYQDRADLYHQKGDLKSACADWQKALDLGLKEAQPKLDSFCAGRR